MIIDYNLKLLQWTLAYAALKYLAVQIIQPQHFEHIVKNGYEKQVHLYVIKSQALYYWSQEERRKSF